MSDFSDPGSLSSITHTVQDVQTAVFRQFGDESGVQLITGDIVRWINMAQEEINNRNKVVKSASHTTTTKDVSTYTFPSVAILQVDALSVDGRFLPSIPYAEARRLMNRNDPASTFEGRPQFWFEYGGQFNLWPKPVQSDWEIQLLYTQKTTPVVHPSDLLGLPDKYFPAIVQYVLQQAYELDEDWQAVTAKSTQFDQRVGQLADEERQSQSLTYETVSVVDDW